MTEQPTYYLQFGCSLDNYEPYPRNVVYGTMEVWLKNRGTKPGLEMTVAIDLEQFDTIGTRTRPGDRKASLEEMRRACYIIDDGIRALPFYVAGWYDGKPAPLYPEGRKPAVILMEFPVNPEDPEMFGGLGGWNLGPRRCFHLKVDAGKLRHA